MSVWSVWTTQTQNFYDTFILLIAFVIFGAWQTQYVHYELKINKSHITIPKKMIFLCSTENKTAYRFGTQENK